MVGIRDIRRKAREALHNAMQVPAVYVPPQGGATVAVAVRLHTKFGAVGETDGFPFAAARHEAHPQIIVRASDLDPARGGIFSISTGEAYEVDNVLPEDSGYVTAQVVRMSEARTAGLPVPGV